MLDATGSIDRTQATNWSLQSEPLSTQPGAAERAPVADAVSRMFAAVPEPGGTPPAERELVASEDSVTAGGVRDAYDMRMYREPDGTYTLELDMKVEFDFTEGPDGQTWTAEEKQQYIEDFTRAVESTWDGHSFTSDTGQQVTLDINLDVVEAPQGFFGGFRDFFDGSENWSIEVVKIDAGGFNQSFVRPGNNTGRFDSEDVNPVDKGATDPQVAAAHEFGHMIGLPDEYNGNGGADAQNDTDSVMHTGMDVRDRHLDIVEDWVNANN